mmetsp:Transcript_106823/g.217901  ORF Transcript_106823/g.217901 Transcript_106823/m.217901 type:complete len:267 (+) Transcript_106823:78-878(+)
MRFCFLFVLQLPSAASLIVKELPALLKDLKSIGKTYPTLNHKGSGDAPWPENIEPGVTYLPQGVGCTSQPEWAKTDSTAPAIEYNTSGWNGFCQMGWSLCPDAVVNKDYSYYWAGLGPDWTKLAGKVDSQYCMQNGWLKPEFRAILHDFEALQAKGEEECKTKWSKYGLDTVGLQGLQSIMRGRLQEHMAGTFVLKESWSTILSTPLGEFVMDESTAGQAAAWNCAMGSVSCDIAYCNHAYCEKSDGSVGIMDECEGWDRIRGFSP